MRTSWKPWLIGARVALVVASRFVSVGALRADPVGTTLQDFFLIGTQPETLTDPLVPGSTDCAFCHGAYDADIAPYDLWRTSLKAQALRDPLFQAALVIANQDAAFAGELCLRCHAPLGWLSGRSDPADGSAMAEGDYEGVTCHVCHRMVDPFYEAGVNPPEDAAILQALADDPDNDIPSVPHSGQYVIDPLDRRRGPFDLIPGFFAHEWLRSPYHQEALLCSTCHDVSNPAFERVGGPIPDPSDTYALSVDDTPHPTQGPYEMFPSERTFSEWLQSDFALSPIEMGGRFGGNKTAVSTCQDCHMPDASGMACGIPSQSIERDDMPLHYFLGATNWVLDAIVNLDQTQELWGPLESSGLQPGEVAVAQARNVAFLEAASDMELSVADDTLTVRIINQTGHKLPTGYPEGRRLWLNVRAYDALDQLLVEYGAYDDTTAALTTADTKVYEALLGPDEAVSQATGIPVGPSFHFAVSNTWYKDNRIPPRGFTNAGFASVQTAPVAYAYADGQYWDDTEFTIPCAATSIEATLYYQTSSKEYVEFLRDQNTTNSVGQVLYDQWVATGKSAPIAMDALTYSGDCNGNDIFDGCDIAGGAADDNANGIPDACESAPPLAEDGMAISCTSDADCGDATCIGGVCYVPKNRYVSIRPNPQNAGRSTARRVSLDLGGGQTAVLGWVGEPVEVNVSGPETSPQLIARIVDEASRHYRDWSVDDLGDPWAVATVHVGDCEISPGFTYLIQSIAAGADESNEANYTEPLALSTTMLFGDVVGGVVGTPPDGDRSFKDISAVVRGFQSAQTEPKSWLDLQGTQQAPQTPDFSNIDFGDINWAVKGFQGAAYPFAAPCDCPGQNCP